MGLGVCQGQPTQRGTSLRGRTREFRQRKPGLRRQHSALFGKAAAGLPPQRHLTLRPWIRVALRHRRHLRGRRRFRASQAWTWPRLPPHPRPTATPLGSTLKLRAGRLENPVGASRTSRPRLGLSVGAIGAVFAIDRAQAGRPAGRPRPRSNQAAAQSETFTPKPETHPTPTLLHPPTPSTAPSLLTCAQIAR